MARRVRVARSDVNVIYCRCLTVVEDQPFPFHLLDDDDAATPFAIDTDILQPSDDAAANPYAQAYIRPRYDVLSLGQASFNRNVSSSPAPDETQEMRDQLSAGRDSLSSTTGFWVMYAKGAFQGDATEDRDPRSEIPTTVGETVFIPENPQASDRHGSLIYLEAIRDLTRNATPSLVDALMKLCASTTLSHEFGHQFGLIDWFGEPGNLMGPLGCFNDPHYFSGTQLAMIRSKGVAR